MASEDENKQPVVIKKVKKGGHDAHHGGQWKVAYADFVTAMMAFFLMLWLLNATTEEQRSGIADYFSPVSVSKSTSGGGGMLSGQTIAKDGALVNKRSPMGVTVELPPANSPDSPEDKDKEDGDPGKAPKERQGDEADQTEAELRAKLREKEQARFEDAAEQLNQSLEAPGLADLKKNVKVDRTRDGLRIQIVDQLNKPMFASGSADPLPRTREVLGRVSQAIKDLPNKVAIEGHTDATPFNRDDYSNWELSADRANASRRVLINGGLQAERVAEVAGRADEELLVPDNPTSPRNRRISILLKYRTEAPGGGGQRARENVNGAAGTATGDTTITATPSPDGDNGAAQQQTGPSILDEQ